MLPLKRAVRVAALVAALPLSGCGGVFADYELAPNGLLQEEDALRRGLAFEPDALYRQVIDGERALPQDDLLRLLYAGIAGRYAGAHDESSRLLDLASWVAEDRVTFRVSREALSLITSDRALPYTPGRTERLMIPYLSALNFLEAGALEGAAVEARRIESLLERMDEGVPLDETPESSRFLHYFASTVFEAAGDRNAAAVAFRRSGAVGQALGSPWHEGAGEATEPTGDVVVLVERGFVPHRVEQSVLVGIPSARVEALTDGSLGEKAAAAAEAAARILATASYHYGDRSAYYRDGGYRAPIRLDPWRDDCRGGDDCRDDNGDETPYLLPIAWPVLYQDPPPPAPIRIRAGDRGVDALARLDLASDALRDFEEQRGALIARTVLRAATKLALTSALEDAVAEKDKSAGEVVGLLTNIGGILTERADTRCWHLLPGSVSMARLRLPVGEHELTLESEQSGRPLSLGTVEVRPGQTTFVSTRLWR